MFKKLFNLLFRRKPPVAYRVETSSGAHVIASTREEAVDMAIAVEKSKDGIYPITPIRSEAELEAAEYRTQQRMQRQPEPWLTPRREDVIRQAARRVRREEAARREFTTSPTDLLNPLNPASPNYVGNINTYNHPVVSECSTRHSHSHHDSGGSSYDSGSSDSSSSSSSCD